MLFHLIDEYFENRAVAQSREQIMSAVELRPEVVNLVVGEEIRVIGADAAIEAADVVFMNSEMSAIPDAVKIAQNTSGISWQNVYFALAVKFIVMLMGLFGFANMWIAVFADTGVSMLCLLNSVRILRMK